MSFVEFRQQLRDLLSKHGVFSNPGWSEEDIVDAFADLLDGYVERLGQEKNVSQNGA